MLRRALLALGVTLSFVLLAMPGRTTEAAAHSIYVNQECSSNGVGVDVILSWSGGNAGARETWVDVSQFLNGWIEQTYATSGAISPNISSFRWVGLAPNSVYYTRVNQVLAPGVWDLSETYVFYTGPACPGLADYSAPIPGTVNSGSYGSHHPFGTSLRPSTNELDYFIDRAIAGIYAPSLPGHPLVAVYPYYGGYYGYSYGIWWP